METSVERKSPVTKRALIQRINRVLNRKDQQLKTCRRNSQWRRDLGGYFIVDINRNWIVDTHVDVERHAKKLKVLQPFEQMIEA